MAVTPPTHPLATAWLERVERLAADLPPGARSELLEDLREHLDAALPPRADGAEVSAVLDRLGDPAEVVAAARADAIGTAPPAPGAAPSGSPAATAAPAAPEGLTTPEVIALAALVLAGLSGIFVWPLTILLWAIGIAIVAVRGRWRGGEVLAMILLPVGWALPVLSLILPAGGSTGTCVVDASGNESCTIEQQSGFVGGPWVLVVLVGGLVLLFLATRWLARAPHGRPVRD